MRAIIGGFMIRKGLITMVSAGILAAIGYYLSGLTDILWAILGALIGAAIGIAIETGGECMAEWLCKKLSHEILPTFEAMWLEEHEERRLIRIQLIMINKCRFKFKFKSCDVVLFAGDSKSNTHLIGRECRDRKTPGSIDYDVFPKHHKAGNAIFCMSFTTNSTQARSETFTLSGKIIYESYFGDVEIPVEFYLLPDARFKNQRMLLFEIKKEIN